MELRKTIRPVHKYDDIDYHDYHQDEVGQRTSPLALDRQAYRGRVIEYNPNLRPAVFPTIPLDEEVSDSATECVNQPSQYSPLSYQQNQYEKSDSERRADTVHQSFDFSSFRDPQMFATVTTNDRWSHELDKDLMTLPSRTPSPKSSKSNGSGNKIYVQNLKLMEKLDKRTEMDWNIAEMETSEEDEVEVIKHHRKVHY